MPTLVFPKRSILGHATFTDFAGTHVCSRRFIFSAKDFSDSDSLVTARIRSQAFCSLCIYIFYFVPNYTRSRCSQTVELWMPNHAYCIFTFASSRVPKSDFLLDIIKDFHFFIFKFINVIPQITPFET